MTDIASPAYVATVAHRCPVKRESLSAHERWMRGRRKDAAKRGYRGPLTRAEAAAAFERANRA